MATLAPGYRAKGWLNQELLTLTKPALSRAVIAALGDHCLIAASGIVAYLLVTRSSLVITFSAVIGCLVCAARGMRGLECLVHEASHLNWTRRMGRNDGLANVLAAWPVMSDVENYRRTHLAHHLELGGERDTDLQRWQELELGDLDRASRAKFVMGLLKRYVPYVTGWWRAIGLDRPTVRRFLLWHGAVITAAALLVGLGPALLVWLLAWGLPITVILPILRFAGEIEEHRYDRIESVAKATYTNVGWLQRLILHPHGDAYHTFHHLFAAVPFYRVRRVHRRLMKDNLGGYVSVVTERTHVRDPTFHLAGGDIAATDKTYSRVRQAPQG